MIQADLANLDALVRVAQRDSRRVWALLDWMAQHGTPCQLRWVPGGPHWACEWAPDGGAGVVAESTIVELAVTECAQTVLRGAP
jgi:pimeloyl-ACP methyl ester carboxylesterase